MAWCGSRAGATRLLNVPHPLLSNGLVILDTPGHNTLGSEPELTLHRVPDAAAIVFMLTAETGVERADADLWAEHIAPIDGLERSCFVVLNKIDVLRDGSRSESQVLAEIDRQVKESAEALAMEPTRVFALSARQALAGKIAGDGDALLKSRLYRLEQALAKRTVHERRMDHTTSVRAEVRVRDREKRARSRRAASTTSASRSRRWRRCRARTRSSWNRSRARRRRSARASSRPARC